MKRYTHARISATNLLSCVLDKCPRRRTKTHKRGAVSISAKLRERERRRAVRLENLN